MADLTLTDRELYVIAMYLFVIAAQTDEEIKDFVPGWVIWMAAPFVTAFFIWILK